MEIGPFEKIEGVPGIALIGKLCTLNDYQQLRNYFNNITITGGYAIIDLTRLTFTSSHGLGIFLGISRRLQTAKKELVLFNPREEIKAVLSLAGIDKGVKVAYNDEELQHMINT
jgi:anti-anti-sigma factor